jgi:hypothetical protein
MILFASTIWISSVSALPQQQTSLCVKIIDPAKGQQVTIGKNLTLSGTASYNAASNCGVFIIVDGVRPYQKTIPTAQAPVITCRFQQILILLLLVREAVFILTVSLAKTILTVRAVSIEATTVATAITNVI